MEVIEWEEHKEECCVVVPVYKRNPVFFEQASLMQCVRVLGKRRDICLVAPYNLDLSEYEALCPGFRFRVKRMAKGFFEGIDGYNQLCKRREFYEAFRDYEYILLYQLDCWVFEDSVSYFVSLGYDYIGAPWFVIDRERNTAVPERCGNGGFSLRRVSKLAEVCGRHADEADKRETPEDVFLSSGCSGELRVCPLDVGREFSFEVGPSVLFRLNGGKLPMGCHKPFLFEFKTFWKDYIKF